MRFIFLSLLLLLGSCSDSTDKAAAPAAVEYHNDYAIGQYSASAGGLYSNSYWVEGPQGVVLIGTQFLSGDAIEAVNIAESYTGKKVVMAIVLHASADQFNGTGVLQQRGIRVVSAAPVVAQIAAEHERSYQQYHGRYGAAYPEQPGLPEALWERTGQFDAAGLRFRAYVVRGGESPAHVLIELDKHLFVGDLVANKYHSSLRLGKSDQWLERLEEIRKFAAPRVIHPGHGYARDATTLLDQQVAYLQGFQQAVAAFYSGGEITPLDKASIAERLHQQFRDYGLDELLAEGIAAEWERLRRSDHMMLNGAETSPMR